MAALLAQRAAAAGSLLQAPRPSLRKTTLPTSLRTSTGLPPVRRSLALRCSTEAPEKTTVTQEEPATGVSQLGSPLATDVPLAPSLAQAIRNPKPSPGFVDVFAFAGPGPELINGRLAMLGFTTAIVVELLSGHSLTRQWGDNAGFAAFIATSALFSAASLIPIFRGVFPSSKPEGFWNASAEIINGRAAMVGLVALAITEFVKGSALIS